MIKILKFWNDFKVLFFVFVIFFGAVYIAIRFDQAMGWEKARAEKNARITWRPK